MGRARHWRLGQKTDVTRPICGLQASRLVSPALSSPQKWMGHARRWHQISLWCRRPSSAKIASTIVVSCRCAARRTGLARRGGWGLGGEGQTVVAQWGIGLAQGSGASLATSRRKNRVSETCSQWVCVNQTPPVRPAGLRSSGRSAAQGRPGMRFSGVRAETTPARDTPIPLAHKENQRAKLSACGALTPVPLYRDRPGRAASGAEASSAGRSRCRACRRR
jgi:hypothetical protein